MPTFHTKTIESVLGPVAQQASQLAILYDEAQGQSMPNLAAPIQAVSKAVSNLAEVGRETIRTSQDSVLCQEMPLALVQVEESCHLLEESFVSLSIGPCSQPAFKTLLKGLRGILQGTYALLVCFDDMSVRKIVRECFEVLKFLINVEAVVTMEDIVGFLQGMAPCLTQLFRNVHSREKELTHQVHRTVLIDCMSSVKNLTPVLVSCLKALACLQDLPAVEVQNITNNRDFLARQMADALNEMIRVLQLKTYDENEWNTDILAVMRKSENRMQNYLKVYTEGLESLESVTGAFGKNAIGWIVNCSKEVALHSLASDKKAIEKLSAEIVSSNKALDELGDDDKEVQVIIKRRDQQLKELQELVSQSIVLKQKSGFQQSPHTLKGLLDQAEHWLNSPHCVDAAQVGEVAISLITAEATSLAISCPLQHPIRQTCRQISTLTSEMRCLSKSDDSAKEASQKALTLKPLLLDLKTHMENLLCQRVVKDFLDVEIPLKKLTETLNSSQDRSDKETQLEEKLQELCVFSQRITATVSHLATISASTKEVSEALLTSAAEVEILAPQLSKAARAKLSYPEAVDGHFLNLSQQYAEGSLRLRRLADEATDPEDFIKATEESMAGCVERCNRAMDQGDPHRLVTEVSTMARLANRVLMVARQECDNSDDAVFVASVNQAANHLQDNIPALLTASKELALDMSSLTAQIQWRNTAQNLQDTLGGVRKSFLPQDKEENPDLQIPVPPKRTDSLAVSNSPARPPLPSEDVSPARPPLPTDDEEYETRFPAPLPKQPIMTAAQGLHQEVRQWSSQDNDIVVAAKQMALLMATLNGILEGKERTKSKKELVACARAIADASEEVTRLAKCLAPRCTDRRMRTNILQVCERIPTIGNQLRILSHVKAVVLGAYCTREDEEATEMLVGNAQNLMQAVKETLRACEAASIKIRTDSGMRIRWIRR